MSNDACHRLGSGAFVSGKLSEFKKRPKEPIILYEFDACPFCRKVGFVPFRSMAQAVPHSL